MFKGNIKNEFGVTGITSNAMEDAITDWMDVYQGKATWVDKTKGIKTIKFAKAVCSETARLTNLALGITFDGSRKDYMTEWCERAIMPNLRRWVEYGCASGTIIIKPNGVGADFVTPDRFEIVGKYLKIATERMINIIPSRNITDFLMQRSIMEMVITRV